MKKTLVAIAALAAVSSFAQSTVTLYGQVGVAFGPVKTDTTTSTVVGNVVTPTSNGSVKTNGMRASDISGSRWGLRGSEDLGGGLRATFNLESGFNGNDGTGFGGGGSVFSRRSVVGFGGSFGDITFGRELTPAVFVSGSYDVDNIETFSTTEHLTSSAGLFRRSNSINYSSPNLSGFSVRGQFAANKNTAANNLPNTNTKTTGGSDNGLGLALSYANGPLAASFAIDQGKNTTVDSFPAKTEGGKHSGWYLGSSYDLGVAKVMGNISQLKVQAITTPDIGDNSQVKQFNLGVQVPMGAVTLMASVGRNTVSANNGRLGLANATSSGKGTDFMVGANYDLSKRTVAYARAGAVDKVSGNAFNAGVLAGKSSTKTSGVVIGMRHIF